jgi:DNA ligase-1
MAPPKAQHQATLASFFGTKPAKSAQKENADNQKLKHASPSDESKLQKQQQRKKRRVIEDDDDEEDEPEMTSKDMERMEEVTDEKVAGSWSKDSTKKSDETMPDSTEEKGKDLAKSPAKESRPSTTNGTSEITSTSSPDEASELNISKEEKEISSAKKLPSKSSSSTLLAKAPKDTVPSDSKILEQIPDSAWPADEASTLPYLFLCQTLSQIEAITGRLQIQTLLTTLLRQVSLRAPADLYPLLYLASNSVAPAYECVELGIGDAILIKAIGEATGTNPSMVKSKYETVGDLGTIAMTFKGKQKTLGGFFKAKSGTSSSLKTKLSAREVLTVFREIASTKGNQAQKWKVDKIKRLLVRASDPLETKYIVRSLQGKLRIGLAESTVLISLAHSWALTTPKTVELSVDELGKGEFLHHRFSCCLGD